MDFVKPEPPVGHIVHFGAKLRGDAAYNTLSHGTFAWGSRTSSRDRTVAEWIRYSYPEVWAEEAASFLDAEHIRYTQDKIDQMIRDARANLDLSFDYFASLDRGSFDSAVTNVRAACYGFRPVNDITRLKGIPGIYLLLLDGVRQMYIGRSADMYRRIRQHWTRHMPLDRLIYGTVETSTLPIDAFRALDTTRIFVLTRAGRTDMSDPFQLGDIERRAISASDIRFSMNRHHDAAPLDDGSFHAVNRRNLQRFQEMTCERDRVDD